jgi:hypothetical protein
MAYLEHRPTSTVYQYCSLDGFRGITQSKRLRFTDLHSANDPREIQLGHGKFIAAFTQCANAETDPGRREYLRLLTEKISSYAGNTRAYCACFSMARDQLPMWATYGAQHDGIAIGFRPTALFGIPARIQLVKYVDDKACEDYRDLATRTLQGFDTRYSPNNIANTLVPAAAAFALMTAQKHNSWSYEQEVRLIHAQRIAAPSPTDNKIFSATGELPDGQIVSWQLPSMRRGPSGNAYFLTFPFGRFKNGIFDPARAIAEVIIGPKCTITKEEASNQMFNNGFSDFSVVKSECQIR